MDLDSYITEDGWLEMLHNLGSDDLMKYVGVLGGWGRLGRGRGREGGMGDDQISDKHTRVSSNEI